MKSFLFVFSLLFLSAIPESCFGQTANLTPARATGVAMYNDLPVGDLALGRRQQLSGQFERALLTYDAALAWQPRWIPILTSRAELLHRMGRDEEAERDMLLASRQNPFATSFFMAKGKGSLLPYLALYPEEWFRKQYAFMHLDHPPAATATPSDYYLNQHEIVTSSVDTGTAVQLIRQKIGNDARGALMTFNELPREYPSAVKSMLRGNLAMLSHDYVMAISLYSDAIIRDGANWSELYYNRGLAHILVFNFVSGCEDLKQAADATFQPAVLMYGCLCTQ